MKKYLKTLFAFALFTSSTLAWADMEEEIVRDCAKIPVYARQGADFYQKKEYLKAREAFEKQAYWQDFCDMRAQDWHEDKQATAYNNVALTYLKAKDDKRENNLLKAAIWMNILPKDKKSQFNFKKISSEINQIQELSYQQPEGVYWQYAGMSSFDKITIKKQGKNSYLLKFEGISNTWNAPYYGSHSGSGKAVIHFKNHQAHFRMPETTCDYALSFTADGIQLKRTDNNGDIPCGFGHNVRMEGDYSRVQRGF